MTNILTQEESEALKTWPEKNYLQHGNHEIPPFHECHEVSWAQDNIHGNDIEYVRLDLYDALLARVAELEGTWIPVADYTPRHCEVMLGLHWHDAWQERPPEFIREHNYAPHIIRVIYCENDEYFDDGIDDFRPGWLEESFVGESCSYVSITHVMKMPTNLPQRLSHD